MTPSEGPAKRPPSKRPPGKRPPGRPPRPRSSSSTAKRPSRRSSVHPGVVVIGSLLVVAIVTVVLMTRSSNDPSPDLATPTLPAVTSSTTPGPTTTLLAAPIPEGDYTAYCEALLAQIAEFNLTSIEDLRVLAREVDFAALIPVAPPGLQPSLEVVRSELDLVIVAIEQLDDFTQIQTADLPAGFLDAFTLLGRASAERCR